MTADTLTCYCCRDAFEGEADEGKEICPECIEFERRQQRGKGGRKPKLTPKDVDTARKHRRAGITSNAIASVFGVSGSTMRRYLRGECRQHRTA